MKSTMIVLTLALAACEGAPDLEDTEQAASTILAKNVSYVAHTGLVGANAQLALDNAGGRIATLEAKAPVPGPQGPVGPQGPAGTQHLNWAQKSWNQTHVLGSPYTDQIPAGGWQTIEDSVLQMTTSGGALMVSLNIQLWGVQYGTCQTIVDGVWAGAYSNGAVVPQESASAGDPYWKEGKLTLMNAWQPWRVTRIYPGVPAGAHTIAVQCASDNGPLTSCAGKTGGCSISVLETP